jgi:uncharacterized membrane protein
MSSSDAGTSIGVGVACYAALALYNVVPMTYGAVARRKNGLRSLWLQRTARDRAAWATACVCESGTRVGLNLVPPSASFVLRNAMSAYVFFGRSAMAIAFVLLSLAATGSGSLGGDTGDLLRGVQISVLVGSLFASFVSFAAGSRLVATSMFVATTPPLDAEAHARLARANAAAGRPVFPAAPRQAVNNSGDPTSAGGDAAEAQGGELPDADSFSPQFSGRRVRHPVGPHPKPVSLPQVSDDSFDVDLEEAERLDSLLRLLYKSAWFWALGIRFFYFGVNAAFWLVSPWLLLVSSVATIAIQVYGDFFSS